MTSHLPYEQASIKTADHLRSVAQSLTLQEVSQLSLPEIDAVVDVISKVVPAGNVPGIILNGLARLPGRRPPQNKVRRDINLLFKGVESALDQAVYGAVIAGPAAVIWGYQNLLKLAGKDPEDSFPEGLWQFYVDYAMREDSARHASETHGFDTLLERHQIVLSPVDRTTAWLMAVINILHQYPEMLANEWRERIFLSLLAGTTAAHPEAAHYASLHPRWMRQRPFRRDRDAAANEDFASYRRRRFDQFLTEHTQSLDMKTYRSWTAAIQERKQELRNYKKQLSIHAYLEPGPYGETRIDLPLSQLHVGLIYKGRYYLIPASAPGGSKPMDVQKVRERATAVYALPTGSATVRLHHLATLKRAEFVNLRRHINPTLAASLERLDHAPVIFNADRRPAELAISEIRQGERGVGNHALTIFDTGQTFVFDASHIFFDGAWGASLAEIITNEALSWGVYLSRLPSLEPDRALNIKPLSFPFESREQRFIEQSARVAPEVSVETDKVNLQLLLTTRELFTQRNDLLRLTVNDLLILYRAIHAVSYRADANLLAELKTLARSGRQREAALEALDTFAREPAINPAILIPIDASTGAPRERLYPMVFEVPLHELNLLDLHNHCLAALNTYKGDAGDRAESFAQFDGLQRTYLATLAGFGQVLSRAREIGIAGESASTGSIKLLANMPPALQRLLDSVPNRFDLLHDLIKGREVFSNIGPVGPDSSLTRFSTAKDDSDKKRLAWGVLTDNQGVMRITLRDFRPYVAALSETGYKSLAVRLAQHYLDCYASGLNSYLRDLRRITYASRETRVALPDNEAND